MSAPAPSPASGRGPLAGPVSLVFTRRVKPGGEAAYRSWVEGFQGASRQVNGFLGASTTGRGPGGYEYTSVVRFDSVENLRAWEQSDLRREWVARLPADILDGDVEIRRLDGLEFWFTAPGLPTPVAPSPHKMVALLTGVVFLLVTVLAPVARALPAQLPAALRTAVMVVLQVALMTYVIMPRVTRLFARWLFPR